MLIQVPLLFTIMSAASAGPKVALASEDVVDVEAVVGCGTGEVLNPA